MVMQILFWVGIWAAVSLVYLAHRHQRWWPRPWPSRPAHAAAWALGLGGGVCGALSLGPGVALLCALVWAMAWAGAWPLLALWRRPVADVSPRSR